MEDAKDYSRRDIVNAITDYVKKSPSGKVCVLSGLRKTGKTTAMQHAMLGTSSEDLKKTAYITLNETNDIAELRLDLENLSQNGFRTVFVDEVTYLEDFIDSASVFSDFFAKNNMTIILSGTWSLSFVLAAKSELYQRMIKIPTTWIPYAELKKLKGINNEDEEQEKINSILTLKF